MLTDHLLFLVWLVVLQYKPLHISIYHINCCIYSIFIKYRFPSTNVKFNIVIVFFKNEPCFAFHFHVFDIVRQRLIYICPNKKESPFIIIFWIALSLRSSIVTVDCIPLLYKTIERKNYIIGNHFATLS